MGARVSSKHVRMLRALGGENHVAAADGHELESVQDAAASSGAGMCGVESAGIAAWSKIIPRIWDETICGWVSEHPQLCRVCANTPSPSKL